MCVRVLCDQEEVPSGAPRRNDQRSDGDARHDCSEVTEETKDRDRPDDAPHSQSVRFDDVMLLAGAG